MLGVNFECSLSKVYIFFHLIKDCYLPIDFSLTPLKNSGTLENYKLQDVVLQA